MNVNFAERAHNHNWKLDPIVRSLLDTDFYKFLMLQFIWKNFPRVKATSEIYNRTVKVRLGERIPAEALREQMDYVTRLKFQRSELVWLAGNTFYGVRQIFEPAFLDWMDHSFRLSDYEISEQDGQLVLRFSGLWTEVTMWEVYSLAIVSEMKTRAALAELNELELDVLYARAKTRLWDKIEKLRRVEGLRFVGLRDAAAAQLPVAGVLRGGSAGGTEYWVRSGSAEPPIPRWLTSTTWRRSERMRMSCRWRWQRWHPAGAMRSCAPHSIGSWSYGSRAITASC